MPARLGEEIRRGLDRSETAEVETVASNGRNPWY